MKVERNLAATVERIRFPKEEDAPAASFYIIKTDIGTVKGRLSHRPRRNETLLLDGSWTVSKYNGALEFAFTAARTSIPTDERAMLKYACALSDGLGPAMEEKIWRVRGEDWRTVSLHDKIAGLTPARLLALQKTIEYLALSAEKSQTVAYLLGLGLTQNLAEAAWSRWQGQTAAIVRGDCYRLAELPGYSFRLVDSQMRRHFDISDGDPRRIDAAISCFLAQLTQENTIVQWADLAAKALPVLEVENKILVDRTKEMFKSGKLVPFAADHALARRADYEAEELIFNAAKNAAALPAPKIRQVPGREFDLDESQLAAVANAISHSLSVINGCAGAGKTTIIRTIVHNLPPNSVELCAFAGKAAARLREATGHAAYTIHKMLGYMGEGVGFSRKSLEGKTVILDEASMVGSDLLCQILRRRPERLVLVGDEAQLPPVGPAQPFHDIIAAFPALVSTLSVCYRNREAVFSAALAVRNAQLPPLSAASDNERFETLAIRAADKVHAEILRLADNGEYDPAQDLVLCCRNGENTDDPCSVAALNRDLKQIFNPNADGTGKIARRDRIICTKNNAALDVWNGTTGTCAAFDTDGAMWVNLDAPLHNGRNEVLVPKDKVRDWQLAYALTVHKSQGSQYRHVVFACISRDLPVVLSRPMVYTAITRARKQCTVIGDRSVLARAIAIPAHKHTVFQQLSRQS